MAVAPKPSATALHSSARRRSISSCTSGWKVRTVPTSVALPGITLIAREVAGLHGAQADHRAVDRPHVARHDALHRRDDVRGHQHRVDRQVGMRAVAALARDFDRDPVGRRHHRRRD